VLIVAKIKRKEKKQEPKNKNQETRTKTQTTRVKNIINWEDWVWLRKLCSETYSSIESGTMNVMRRNRWCH